MSRGTKTPSSITGTLRIALFLAVAVSLVSLFQSRNVDLASPVTTPVDTRSTTTKTQKASPVSTSLVDDYFASPCESDNDCKVPKWMLNYFKWHRERLQQLRTSRRWEDQPLLVVRCINDDRCGGTADRLKGLPFYFVVAAMTKRLLFLRWNRPYALEEFMVPREETINWTVPETLIPLLDNTTSKSFAGGKAMIPIVKSARDSSIWLVEAAAQLAGGDLYMQLAMTLEGLPDTTTITEPPIFFHDMFLTLFQPSPRLRPIVVHQLQELQLHPNQFVTAHIRSKYPGEPYRETWNLTLLERTVEHAVDCASSLESYSTNASTRAGTGTDTDTDTDTDIRNLPVYVASDTLAALQAAQSYGKSVSYRVVSHIDAPNDLIPQEDPLHLNFAKTEDPSEFFSIFTDMWIMSQSQCVSFGAGGFGRFGSLVSYNRSCQIAHSTKGRPNPCPSLSLETSEASVYGE